MDKEEKKKMMMIRRKNKKTVGSHPSIIIAMCAVFFLFVMGDKDFQVPEDMPSVHGRK